MLKGIPEVLSPQLLKVLAEMGHSDVIMLADGNFPCESIGKDAVVVRADGLNVPELLDAILTLMPLDDFVEKPVTLMEVAKTDPNPQEPVIWQTIRDIVAKHDERGNDAIGFVERFDFYDLTKKAYAIISTSEKATYACVLMQKGVVRK